MDENQTADLDSTLNEEEEVIETQEESKPDPIQKKKDSVVKLLADRNRMRNELKELKAKTESDAERDKRLADLEELVARQALESETKQQKAEFFAINPKAKEFEQDIDRLREEKDLTIEEAFRLVASEKDPTLLMDEQYRNKSTSSSEMAGVPRDNAQKHLSEMTRDEVTVDDIKNMSDDDFLKLGNSFAEQERKAGGFLR